MKVKMFLATTIFFCICQMGFGQIDQGIYVSLHGNWAPNKQDGRAVFAGNNGLLKIHFSSYAEEFSRAAARLYVNELVEIVFTVSKDGNVKDASFVKKSENLNLNVAFLQALSDTDGKWSPGKINGEPVETSYKMWGYFFSGAVEKYRLQEIKPLILEAKEKGQFKKAIRLADIALLYVPIDEEYNKIKAELLALDGNSEKLNIFLESIAIYDFSFVSDFKN